MRLCTFYDNVLGGAGAAARNNWQWHNLDAYHVDRWMPRDGRPVGLSVSGGRSSAYQMAHIVEANRGLPQGLVPHFSNTGLEDPRTIAFLKHLDREFELNLRVIEFDMNAPSKVREVTLETLSMDGRPFLELLFHEIKRRDGTVGVRPLPNPAQRTCTAQLKIKTWHRYVRQNLHWPTQYYDIIGYRADEPKRFARRTKRDEKVWEEGGRGLFPMYHAGVVTQTKEDFWFAAPFDLEMSSDHGNCDFCFMLSTWKLKERMLLEALDCHVRLNPATPPPRVQRWIDFEERTSDRPGVFRRDRPSYRSLWEQVCAGNMESAVVEGKNDVCESCSA